MKKTSAEAPGLPARAQAARGASSRQPDGTRGNSLREPVSREIASHAGVPPAAASRTTAPRAPAKRGAAARQAAADVAAAPAPRPELPFNRSVGYQIRETHRLVQRALQARIEKEGVTLGMWYFLRVLWEEDGLTQRELSRRVGTMEPTTQSALQAMEAAGFLSRERNTVDKRKLDIHLTPAGRALRGRLLPAGIDVVNVATGGLSPREVDLLLGLLAEMQRNLALDLRALGAAESEAEES